MDLSGDGFLNDGMAKPLEADHAGIVANVNAAGNSSTLNISITLSQAAPAGTVLKLYYYEGNAELHTVEMTVTGTTASAVITSTAGRLHLVKITAGDSWWFNNDSLISCTVSLRSVETRPDNPELQISDIEIVGYEPNNVLSKLSMIGENVPVYYTSGYPGDMAPVRKFYVSEPITWKDKQLTIKAEDATRFLDDEYDGLYIGNGESEAGSTTLYINAIHNMLTAAGIDHYFDNQYTGSPFNTGSAILLPNISKRELLAQAINLLHVDLHALNGTTPLPLFVNYVDAGIPKLWTGLSNEYTVIEDITSLEHNTDQMVKRVRMQAWVPFVIGSESVEQVQTGGKTIRTTSDPYYSFSSSGVGITKLSPYKYSVNAAGTANVSGRKITMYDRTTDGGYSLVRGDGKGVRTIEMKDFYGWQFFSYSESIAVTNIMYGLLYRGIETYKFIWRGDPKLQPRDHIRVKVDGTYVDMTIDTVTLNHEDGGLTSEIFARKGWI